MLHFNPEFLYEHSDKFLEKYEFVYASRNLNSVQDKFYLRPSPQKKQLNQHAIKFLNTQANNYLQGNNFKFFFHQNLIT